MKFYSTLLLFLVVLLSGCSASITDFKDSSPELKLEQFFNGPLRAHGMVQDRSGKITGRFSVNMVGRWQGNSGVLEEDFIWDDGRKQQRIWYLTKTADNRYTGTASDVIGTAVGTTAGNALNWKYQLSVPTDYGELDISLDDWMYLLDNKRMFNRTKMTYFGFYVGELTLYIEQIQPVD